MKRKLVPALLLSALLPLTSPLSASEIHRSDMYTDDDYNILTEVIYFEARDQTLIGQVAVSLATLNRVEHPRFPNSLREVAHYKARNKYGTFTCAYSYYCDGKPEVYNEKGPYRESKMVADLVLTNNVKDFTNGATLYFNPDLANPSWAYSVCVEYKGKWGDHEFYDQVRWTGNCKKLKKDRKTPAQ